MILRRPSARPMRYRRGYGFVAGPQSVATLGLRRTGNNPRNEGVRGSSPRVGLGVARVAESASERVPRRWSAPGALPAARRRPDGHASCRRVGVACSAPHDVGNLELSQADMVESNSRAVRANIGKCPASGMKTVLLSGDRVKLRSSSSSP
jgi:hypothetical protein